MDENGLLESFYWARKEGWQKINKSEDFRSEESSNFFASGEGYYDQQKRKVS